MPSLPCDAVVSLWPQGARFKDTGLRAAGPAVAPRSLLTNGVFLQLHIAAENLIYCKRAPCSANSHIIKPQFIHVTS